MPYQCLAKCGKVLIAARGSSIDSFNLEDGSLLSTWKCLATQKSKTLEQVVSNRLLETPELTASSEDVVLHSSSPPAKRRKLSAAGEDADPNSSEKQGKKKGAATAAVVSGLEAAPAVIALAVTANGQHVIAVTEDKSIRVFENLIEGNGKQSLKQLSQRIMPKRPCAIAITEDDSTIISADKFGDLYSLPLLVPKTTGQESLQSSSQTPEPTPAKPFVPAANHLTVHSQRNLKTLENQMRQTNRAPEKSEPSFEHKLLLGHVSMLTDIALVSLEERNHILTADRDEHIRVSRGIPQAHIIEGFCLGHTNFISRLCIPSERSDVLISGGGDDNLFVWDWASGVLISKADLTTHVAVVMHEVNGDFVEDCIAEPFKVVVSGIRHVRQVGNEGAEDLIIVSCEGVPAAFTFLLTSQGELHHLHTLKLLGNALTIVTDVAGGLILSIDSIHKPGSTTDYRENIADGVDSLQKFLFQGRELVPSSIKFKVVKEDDEMKRMAGRLSNLLYNLENLRKRDGGDWKDDE